MTARRAFWVGLAMLVGGAAGPVKAVAPDSIAIGGGRVPVYASADWQAGLADLTRAVIVVHGLARNADTYFAGGLAARAQAGTAGEGVLILAPQFLADIDISARGLPPETLHWGADDWAAGYPAHGPSPVSAFDALDAILDRLADRALFPALRQVVVAGHSAGGQVVQRYAVVGHGGAGVRYVVANPSSYVYFTAERPYPEIAALCPGFNDWRYGFAAGVPPYVTQPAPVLEARFATRQVVYLLGTADTDPNHRVLDRSCEAEAEGPYRYARGHAFFDYMRARHPDMTTQTLHDVPGVAHDGPRMLGSACGLAALFDTTGCPKD